MLHDITLHFTIIIRMSIESDKFEMLVSCQYKSKNLFFFRLFCQFELNKNRKEMRPIIYIYTVRILKRFRSDV